MGNQRDRKMKQKLMLLAVVTYAAALILSAWPIGPTWMILSRLSSAATSALGTVAVIPGLRLFYNPNYEPLKVRHQCFTAKAFDADAKVLQTEKTGIGCRPRFVFHWLQDHYETLIFRIYDEALMERLNVAQKVGEVAWKKIEFANGREKALLAVLGEHYCRRFARKTSERVERVVVSWKQTLIEYQTGQHGSRHVGILNWSCTLHDGIEHHWTASIPPEKIDEIEAE